MTPRYLMLLGAIVGLLGVVAEILMHGTTFGIMIFAAGALFGKGYGIWEVYNDRPNAKFEIKSSMREKNNG